jgi:hypothetical protein
MTMIKRRTDRLALRADTVRHLTTEQLHIVAAGATNGPNDTAVGCPTSGCPLPGTWNSCVSVQRCGTGAD